MKPTQFNPHPVSDELNVASATSSLPGRVKTIGLSLDSSLEPAEIYSQLGKHQSMTNCMLLESSEIGSKANVKSILMLSAAIRIECNGRQVNLKSLNANGQNALTHIHQHLLSAQQTDKRGDFELIHTDARLTLQFKPYAVDLDEDSRLKSASPIDVLRTIKNAFEAETNSQYAIFLCGVFAFDFIESFESLPSAEMGDNTCPDFVFYLAESILVFDHLSGNQRLLANRFSGQGNRANLFELSRKLESLESLIASFADSHLITPDTVAKKSSTEPSLATPGATLSAQKVDISNSHFQSIVGALKQHIIQGDVFQVVPSRTFSTPCYAPLASYRILKQTNPSPYLFYLQDEDFILFGASPESALKYSCADNQVLLYPIAGTRPRGKNSNDEIDIDLDTRIEAELKLDQKEVAEHMMLVDLARNDIARIAMPGTTHVPKLLSVDRYSQVMHLVSCVKGQLREDLDALHAYQACLNMGTLTGAPKIKATELIRQTEKKRRGSYGGAVGYINGQGDMDTCIVIRSAFCRDNMAYVQAGAGIVYDSDPAAEATETQNKAQAVLLAIAQANRPAEEIQS